MARSGSVRQGMGFTYFQPLTEGQARHGTAWYGKAR
jgi:hypothetical protein